VHAEQQAIMDSLRDDYREMRMLEDGTIIACHKLITSVSLIVGINRNSWERRYCYPSYALARKAFDTLQTCDDAPMPGYIAQRPEIR
jgi:hypothetical protein